jgi:hypothetical protein
VQSKENFTPSAKDDDLPLEEGASSPQDEKNAVV